VLARRFKVEADAISLELRAELRLDMTAPLDPRKLADFLEIEIIPLSKLKGARGREHFLEVEVAAFSAVTVFDGSKRVIVHNDAHQVPRQTSNISHELAHGLLLHPPSPPLDLKGLRTHDAMLEEEASWLGAVLLVPEEAALHVARKGWTTAEAAVAYGVSEPLMRWRLNMTAARRRVA
jgi:Zn-dependent peptidase ImmA (M78 family)